jgi:hypothetical protein
MIQYDQDFEGDGKYILNRTDRDELYNLESDPLELANLAEHTNWADRIKQMHSMIKDMVTHTGPGYYEWCLNA